MKRQQYQPNQPCIVCGEPSPSRQTLRKGRCVTCDGYFRCHGVERPCNLVKRKRYPPNQQCIVCGRSVKPLRKGRCHACNEYFRREGVERPYKVNGHEEKPKRDLTIPCRRCARPIGSTGPVFSFPKQLCASCNRILDANAKKGTVPAPFGLDRRYRHQGRQEQVAREESILKRFTSAYSKPIDPDRLLDDAEAMRLFSAKVSNQ